MSRQKERGKEVKAVTKGQQKGIVIIFAFVLVVGARTIAEAQSGTGLHLTPQGQLTSGGREFRTYCAQCHGRDAKGDGPVAPSLKTKPPDLTVLSKTHGGVFPYQYVFNSIAGTDVASTHGTREMPVWGRIFALPSSTQGAMGAGGNAKTQEQVNARIKLIVDYIQSIQAK